MFPHCGTGWVYRMLKYLPFFIASIFAADSSIPIIAPFDSAWHRLMQPNGFRNADMDLLINFPGKPVQALSAVTQLLRSPRSVDSLVPLLRRDLSDTAMDGFVRSDSLWKWLNVDRVAPASSHKNDLQGWIKDAEQNLKAYQQPLSKKEIGFLQREVPPLLRQSGEDTALKAVEEESLRLKEDAITDEVMRLAVKLQKDKLAEAAHDIDEALYFILADVRDNGWRKAADHLRALKNSGIPVEIGTEGPDVHHLKKGIVFDPGGNDRYEFPDSSQPGNWLLVIDLAGDDEYHATDSVGGAAAFLSLQVIADMKGNDRYLGRDFAFASAIMGYSRLLDASGNDMYEGRCASLGFAFHGTGLLQDLSGNDVYTASYSSEGASSTFGLGILLDRSGNDQYLIRPDFVDDLRYRDHFLSLSQGFSTGFSPKYAGGIGVLWDQSGEDLYSVDIFGEGTGYWFSWGLLMDDEGNDKYLAHQYAQGAGVHFAVGTLWDRAGNDLRVSKGVSQGCGHDGGFGMLIDEQGHDKTVSTDMSTGAGSANGLGIYLDYTGDDVYEVQNPLMTLGHGDLRRDRGSMGFFLDLHGKDRYPPEFKNGSAWKVYDAKHRGYGYGLDAE